jgi:hypothetical protein
LFVGLYEFSTSPIDDFGAQNLILEIAKMLFFFNKHDFIAIEVGLPYSRTTQRV